VDAAVPVSRHKILTHQDDIARLRICKHISSYIVCICVLQAARK